jgi:hypothetical protein
LDLAIITTFEHEITQHLLPQVNGKLWTSATILSSFVLLYPRLLYFMQSKGRQRVLSTCMLEVDFYSNAFNYLYQGSACWNFSAVGNKSNVSMLKGGVAIFNERLFCTSGYSAFCQFFSKFVCFISDPFRENWKWHIAK